jgi:hypothetical protein
MHYINPMLFGSGWWGCRQQRARGRVSLLPAATGEPVQFCTIPPTKSAGRWGGTMRDTNPGRPARIRPVRAGGHGAGACGLANFDLSSLAQP